MIVHAYYPHFETRVQREAEALVQAGYEVDVICPRDGPEPRRARYRGVEIHRLPVRIEKGGLARQLANYLHFFVRATARVAALHRRRPYRTVQVHNLPDFLVGSAVVPKLRGVPVILDLHDLMPEFVRGRFGENARWFTRAVLAQERAATRFADHVITVSDHWRRTLIDRGVPPSRCSVVMNVADEQLFDGWHGEDGPGRFQLVYHGTVTHRYGLDLAVRAVHLVREQIPEVELLIVGDGDGLREVLDLRARLGVESSVTVHEGFVVAEELPRLLRDAVVGLAPYRDDAFTDGLLPTKLMEYAVMGLPCIGARTTAIDSYFRGTMVEFFEPGDAEGLARCIVRLHDDPAHRAALAERSRVFTERYGWDRVGAEYVALVRRLGRVPAAIAAPA